MDSFYWKWKIQPDSYILINVCKVPFSVSTKFGVKYKMQWDISRINIFENSYS